MYNMLTLRGNINIINILRRTLFASAINGQLYYLLVLQRTLLNSYRNGTRYSRKLVAIVLYRSRRLKTSRKISRRYFLYSV